MLKISIILILCLFVNTKFLKPVLECGTGKKDLKNHKVLDNNNEKACIDFCYENFPGLPYSAVNDDTCYCLSLKEYKSITKGKKSDCNIKCKKKDSEFCGGIDAYAISPVYTCYKINNDPTLVRHLILIDSKNMSIERCKKACLNYNSILDRFAISDGNKCHCSVVTFDIMEDEVEYTLCNKNCPGNNEQVCGGEGVYNTYTKSMTDRLSCESKFEIYDDMVKNKKYHKPAIWRSFLEQCAEVHNFEYELPPE
ncbi:hypothetical protein HK099_000775, partial [Clydaea vesicula]